MFKSHDDFKRDRTIAALMLLTTATAQAHKGHHHPPVGADAPKSASGSPDDTVQEKLKRIAASYTNRIQPIFQRACFDCHSDQTRYPWYHSVPGVRQWIDSDIEEAKEHVNFTSGFPFAGHATPAEDLDAIGDSIRDGDMPPWPYRLLHPRSRLSEEEKTAILDWVKEGRFLLKGESP